MQKRSDHPRKPGFVLGRAAFDRISAVEGLRREPSSEAMFADFDRRGLSEEERREAIRARHGQKTAPALDRRRADG